MVVDLVDKQLLIELGGNCRLSYQTLARYLGLTVNAVKKRINKLVDTGVIDHFAIMINSGLRFGKGKVYFLFSQVWCEELIDQDIIFNIEFLQHRLWECMVIRSFLSLPAHPSAASVPAFGKMSGL